MNESMLCPDVTNISFGLFDFTIAPSLLFYAYIPIIVVSLFFGSYVLFKNKFSLQSKLLLTIAISFSFWILNMIVQWIIAYVNISYLAWSLTALIEIFIPISAVYFVYVFLEKGLDVPRRIKGIFLALIAFVAFLTPTRWNMRSFDLVNCESNLGSLLYYVYGFEILAIFWVLFISIKKYRSIRFENEVHKKEILFLMLGVILFLGIFSASNIFGEITNIYEINLIGPIGMVLFIAFLSYIIVKYKAFHMKLLASQALVIALIILIGSEFFFANSTTNKILIGITLLISIVFGWALIKSVKSEVQRKEELQIMSDKLAVANEQLVKLDNAKSEFISIASHQLRTPLTAIKGFVSLLLEGTYGKIETKVRDALNKVYLSNERMVNLVENLLNVSRIESGRMEYQYGLVKVESILKELYDTFAITAKNKGLALEFKLPPNPLPEVEVDGPKTREIISNLIDNALKYTDKGSVTVTVEPAGEFLRVTVSDTGIGIPKGELPYLFNKFSRGKDTNRLHVTGTGLGLFVGKQMIEAQHGRLWSESDGEGKGSRFIVELPISQKKYQK